MPLHNVDVNTYAKEGLVGSAGVRAVECVDCVAAPSRRGTDGASTPLICDQNDVFKFFCAVLMFPTSVGGRALLRAIYLLLRMLAMTSKPIRDFLGFFAGRPGPLLQGDGIDGGQYGYVQPSAAGGTTSPARATMG